MQIKKPSTKKSLSKKNQNEPEQENQLIKIEFNSKKISVFLYINNELATIESLKDKFKFIIEHNNKQIEYTPNSQAELYYWQNIKNWEELEEDIKEDIFEWYEGIWYQKTKGDKWEKFLKDKVILNKEEREIPNQSIDDYINKGLEIAI